MKPIHPFADARSAALAVLNHATDLNRRTGQFLGTLVGCADPLTERQEKWLSDLLRKYDLPPLAEDVARHG